VGLREMTMGKFIWQNRCKLCGQYILEGEEVYIVYPPPNDKTLTWGIVHRKELDAISEGMTEDEKMNMLRGKKMPKFKGFTEEQKANAEFFKQVCYKRGYKNETLSKRTLKMGKRGTSFVFTYDMITGKISSDYRGRTGLFDGLFINQWITEIQREVNILQGKTPCKVVTASSVIQKAVDKTNEFFNR
jgi:hypothetical protein